MKRIFALCCLCLVFGGCTMFGGDKSEVENLVKEWSKLDPSTIGGPSELKNIKEIKGISVGEITDSKWNKLGCKDCKETEVTLVGLYNDGSTKNIVYQLRKLDGNWAITAWKIEGTNAGGACFPFIDLEVISARKSLHISTSATNDNEFENQLKTDLIGMLHNKVIVKNIDIKNVDDNSSSTNKVKEITFDCTLLFTDDLRKENGGLAFNKGMTVIEENNIFTYTKENDAWKLTKLFFGSAHSVSNYDPQILEDNNKPNKAITTTNFPAYVKYNGTYIDGIKWIDKNGTNYLVISQVNAGEFGKSDYKSILFGCCFADDGNEIKKLWEIQDAADIVSQMEYIKGSLKVVDIDNDGVCENIFLYQKGTDGEGAIPLKLMLHSGSNKYAIRGEFCPQKDVCGDYHKLVLGDEFSKANSSFRVFATTEWNSVCRGLIK